MALNLKEIVNLIVPKKDESTLAKIIVEYSTTKGRES